jgi:predicted HTH transcriptional regulator
LTFHFHCENVCCYDNLDSDPNRVAIYNPEDFVNNDLSSKIRNELICKTLFKCKAVETWGTGLRNTFNLCESKNIKLGYEKEHDGFWFFFYRTNVTVNDKIKLTEIEQKVLIVIKNNPKITREILSAELNRTSRQIQRVIDSLKKKTN